MRAILIKIAVAFSFSIPLLLILDFLQFAAPASIFTLTIVWSLFTLILFQLDETLASRDTSVAQRPIIPYLAFVLILNSIILNVIQPYVSKASELGFLASNFDVIENWQRSLAYTPIKSKLEKLASVVAKAESVADQKSKNSSSDENRLNANQRNNNQENNKEADKKEANKENLKTKIKSAKDLAENKIKLNQIKLKQDSDITTLTDQQLTSGSFYEATNNFNTAQLEAYLKKGYTHSTIIDKYQAAFLTALIQQKNRNAKNIINFYFTKNLKPNQTFKIKSASENTPSQQDLLTIASQANNTAIIPFLIEKGVTPTKAIILLTTQLETNKEKARQTKLLKLYTLLSGKTYTTPSLIKQKDNSHSKKQIASLKLEPNAALIKAIEDNDLSMLKDSITKGANVNKKLIYSDFPFPIFLAAQSNQAGIFVATLVKAGAKVNKKSTYGYNALTKHVQFNRYKAIRVLLKAKIKVNSTAKDKSTALYYAAKNNLGNIISLLIQYGAKVDAVLHNGMTPLMQAASRGNRNAVQILLKHGANPQLRDRKGYTSIQYAKWNGFDNIATMLIKKKNSKVK